LSFSSFPSFRHPLFGFGCSSLSLPFIHHKVLG
jgi:hypothetical protein